MQSPDGSEVDWRQHNVELRSTLRENSKNFHCSFERAGSDHASFETNYGDTIWMHNWQIKRK